MTNRQECTTGRQDDMTNWQDDRTIRQDDIENRHRVIFGPRYHSMAPGSPSLLSTPFQVGMNKVKFNELSLYESLT